MCGRIIELSLRTLALWPALTFTTGCFGFTATGGSDDISDDVIDGDVIDGDDVTGDGGGGESAWWCCADSGPCGCLDVAL